MTKHPIVFTKSDPLDQSPLYALSSRKSLATLLGTELGRLQALADQPDNYRVLPIENAGKKRVIEIPKPALRQVQRRIFELLDGVYSGSKAFLLNLTQGLAHELGPDSPIRVQAVLPGITRTEIWERSG